MQYMLSFLILILALLFNIVELNLKYSLLLKGHEPDNKIPIKIETHFGS